MSNYTKTVNFATKDNLNSGNPLKIVKGTEIDTEYNNIATAVATKTDNSSAAITGGTIVGITDLAVADGGTGASTAANALNNLLPSQTGNANKYLQTDGTNPSWDAVSLSTADITGTLGVANGGTGVTTSTGTTNVVLSNSPTLVTPILGTPTSATLTNATGLPISTGVSGLGTGVATFLATPSSANLASAITDETGSGALVFATSPTLVTPVLGTPTSGTLTNATGLPISTGVSGLGTGIATFLATPSSANLAAALTDETGTGANVFATSPTLVTPLLGTPTSGVATNLTGLPLTTGVTGLLPIANGGTATATPSIVAGSNVTVTGTWPNQTIASTAGGSGTVTSVAATVPSLFSISGSPITTSGTLAMTYSGTALPVANGGTGQTSYTDGQLLIGNTTGNTLTKTTLTAGSGITITNGSGAITIASSGGASAATPTALGTVYGATPSGGNQNVSIGYNVLSSLTTGQGNSGFGFNALLATTTGIENSAFGAEYYTGAALRANTTGNSNAAYATGSLASNTTGSNNSAFGFSSLYSNTTASNGTALGYKALYSNTTGASNTSVGYQSLNLATTANENVALGFYAGGYTTTSPSNIYVGYYAGTTHGTSGTGHCVYIGNDTTCSAGGVNDELVLSTRGSTGKGTTTGLINAGGGGIYQGNNLSSWSTTSDQRLKKNIVDNNIGLDAINSIRVRNFEYRLPEEITDFPAHTAIKNQVFNLA